MKFSKPKPEAPVAVNLPVTLDQLAELAAKRDRLYAEYHVALKAISDAARGVPEGTYITITGGVLKVSRQLSQYMHDDNGWRTVEFIQPMREIKR